MVRVCDWVGEQSTLCNCIQSWFENIKPVCYALTDVWKYLLSSHTCQFESVPSFTCRFLSQLPAASDDWCKLGQTRDNCESSVKSYLKLCSVSSILQTVDQLVLLTHHMHTLFKLDCLVVPRVRLQWPSTGGYILHIAPFSSFYVLFLA